MKVYLFIFHLCLSIIFLNPGKAQQNQYLSSGDSDPEAVQLLDRVISKLEEIGTYEMKFTVNLVPTNGAVSSEKSSLWVQRNRFRFESKDQLVISDGIYVYYYLRDRNEVQITDMDEEGQSLLSPTFFLQFHHSKEYACAITGDRGSSGNATLLRVDFKPVNKFAEYRKLGIDVNPVSLLPEYLIAILSDGTRLTIEDIKVIGKDNLESDAFLFDVTKYPGISIQDLRLD